MKNILGVLLILTSIAAPASAMPLHHNPAETSAHDQAKSREPGSIYTTPVIQPEKILDLEAIIPRLAGMRVVLLGESHDRYEHHLAQLEIIRSLHAMHPRLAIAMEAFQQPFQGTIDAYINGELDLQEFLRGTEWYRRWKYDYRLYAPILEYARNQRLPVVALNLPAELTQKVGRSGLDSLQAEEQQLLPESIDRSDDAYRERLKRIYDRHPDVNGHGFDNFMDVQLLWDEGMAERAAEYLSDHPDHKLVILAGAGHVAYGAGIPRRLKRRLPVPIATVLMGMADSLEPGLADYVLLPEPRTLPASGRIGAYLDEQDGALMIERCIEDSACTATGLKKGDRILSVNGETTNDIADLRLMMWDKKPGETVTLDILRKRRFLKSGNRTYTLELR